MRDSRHSVKAIALILALLGFSALALAKTNTTTTLSSSANPSTYGSSVTFTATVSPSAATGTVTFKNGSAMERHVGNRYPQRWEGHLQHFDAGGRVEFDYSLLRR
jgi:hypothetical protein